VAIDDQCQQVKLFSLKRLLLAIVLGLLIPLSYSFLLSEASDLAGKSIPQFLVAPFGWPRPLWIRLMGRHPSEGDLIGGIIFIAGCNIALYGTIAYVGLLALSWARRKPTSDDRPPVPEPHKWERVE